MVAELDAPITILGGYMQKQPLAELIHDLEQEMLRLGYTKGSMQFYRRQWKSLLRFAQEQEELYFSERLGIDFVEKHFHIFVQDASRILLQSEMQKLRIVRMIGDFQLHRTILRRYYKHEEILTETLFYFDQHPI
jgi:integrase/recombinase XerD